MPAAVEKAYWNLVQRDGLIRDELRQRNPPAATITYFPPEAGRLPLVQWHILEEERGQWRAGLEEKCPDGYDEAESEEVLSAKAERQVTLA